LRLLGVKKSRRSGATIRGKKKKEKNEKSFPGVNKKKGWPPRKRHGEKAVGQGKKSKSTKGSE